MRTSLSLSSLHLNRGAVRKSRDAFQCSKISKREFTGPPLKKEKLEEP